MEENICFVGHNIKGDFTRLRTDFGLSVSGEQARAAPTPPPEPPRTVAVHAHPCTPHHSCFVVYPELMLDATLGTAPERAVNDVRVVKRSLCVAHAMMWLGKNHGSFIDRDEAESVKEYKARRKVTENTMRADIKQFTNSPFPQHEASVGRLMLEQWSEHLHEPQVAEDWGKAWLHEETVLLRSGISPLGGIPNDNNGLEGTNGVQKQDFKFARSSLTTFLEPAHFPPISVSTTTSCQPDGGSAATGQYTC